MHLSAPPLLRTEQPPLLNLAKGEQGNERVLYTIKVTPEQAWLWERTLSVIPERVIATATLFVAVCFWVPLKLTLKPHVPQTRRYVGFGSLSIPLDKVTPTRLQLWGVHKRKLSSDASP